MDDSKKPEKPFSTFVDEPPKHSEGQTIDNENSPLAPMESLENERPIDIRVERGFCSWTMETERARMSPARVPQAGNERRANTKRKARISIKDESFVSHLCF